MNKIKIFISHAEEDEHYAHKLRGIFINAYGFDTYAFKKSNKLAQQRDDIIEEIVNADVFIALISKNYEKCAFANQEAGIAYYLKRRIVPPIIDDTTEPFGFLKGLWGDYEVLNPDYTMETVANLVTQIIFENQNYKPLRQKARDNIVDALVNSIDFIYSNPAMRIIMKVEGLKDKHKNKIQFACQKNRNIKEEQFIFPVFKTYFKNKFDIDL